MSRYTSEDRERAADALRASLIEPFVSAWRDPADEVVSLVIRALEDRPIGEDRALPHNGTDMSRRAALAVRPRAGTQRAKILNTVVAWSGGLTREEIGNLTGFPESSIRPRVLELIEGGHLREADRTRKTRAGQQARVLVAVP